MSLKFKLFSPLMSVVDPYLSVGIFTHTHTHMCYMN